MIVWNLYVAAVEDGAAGTGGGALAGEEVEDAGGLLVGGVEGVLSWGAPARQGALLPNMVDGGAVAGELHVGEDRHLRGAGLHAKPGHPESEVLPVHAGLVVGHPGGVGDGRAVAKSDRHQRFRPNHSVAVRVDGPGDPPCGRERGAVGDGDGGVAREVGPVQV